MGSIGRILDIDLTKRKWVFSSFPEELESKSLIGRGFNVWFLYHNVTPGTDPLGPKNVLILSCGLLTGTFAPASSRLHINALSPLTGLLGSSNVGGDFAVGLRSCGIQYLILRGRSSTPVYLLVNGDTVEIHDAQFLWGLDTWETQKRIKEVHRDERLNILTIGPGGENKALFACIMAERDHAAGRTGMGAVMGSKNLKAIVVKKQILRTDVTSSRQREIIKEYIGKIKNAPKFEALSTHGGAGYVKWADEMGILCTRNYRENRFEAAEQIDGKRLLRYKTRSKGCHRCPVRCKAELRFPHSKYGETKGSRPEFEPMVSLGSKCGLSDLETLVHLDNLCSRLGLDGISAGSAIAFAMDLYDRGLLSSEDTGGMDLTWGNGSAMETLIRQMAYQEGLGAILSQGVRRAAEIIGLGSDRFAAHVKGLELSAYHPYYIMGTALGYAVSSRGGDFNHFFPSIEYVWSPEQAAKELGTPKAIDLYSIHGKGLLVKRAMLVTIVLDILSLCKVPALCLIGAFDLENEATLTRALTGWSLDAEMLFKAGERIANLERLFTLKHGATSDDDSLPRMFFEQETPSGEDLLERPDWLRPMVQDFYRVMGWDEKGRPSEKTLRELDLWDDIPGPDGWKKAS